jgi:NAD(P)-dependent dehydrogenase (short-subunit alcohol dehydrogenase family)
MAGHLRIFPAGSSKRSLMASAASDLTLDGLCTLSSQFIEAVKNGLHSNEGWPNTCYGTSKCALIAMTKIISRMEPSILINSCCPGYCSTDMSSHRGTKTASEGSETPIMLANLSSGGPTGKFFSDGIEEEW